MPGAAKEEPSGDGAGLGAAGLEPRATGSFAACGHRQHAGSTAGVPVRACACDKDELAPCSERRTEQGWGWVRRASSDGIVRGVWVPPARVLPDATLFVTTCRASGMCAKRLRSRLV